MGTKVRSKQTGNAWSTDVKQLTSNCAAEVVLVPQQPISCDTFDVCPKVVVASSELDVMGGARPRPVGRTMGIRGPHATSIPTSIPITKVLDTESILFCCRPIQVQRIPLILRQFP